MGRIVCWARRGGPSYADPIQRIHNNVSGTYNNRRKLLLTRSDNSSSKRQQLQTTTAPNDNSINRHILFFPVCDLRLFGRQDISKQLDEYSEK